MNFLFLQVSLFDVRRGREGLAALTKDTYKRTSYNNIDYYEKTKGESTKNHHKDSVRNNFLLQIELSISDVMS